MNENETIIIVQDQEELTRCQLRYLLEVTTLHKTDV